MPRGPRPGRLAVLLVAFPVLCGWSFFDPFHENVEQGNRKAVEGEAQEALQRYSDAAQVDPGSPIPDFNRGVVLSGEGETEQAREAFLGAAAAADPQVAADALYNLGNVLMEAQELEPAVEAYLKSLDLDPGDADARRNLEIALQRLQQQQQQQQQQEPQDDGEEEEQQDPQQQPQEPNEEEESPPEPEPDPEQEEEQPEPQPQEQDEEKMSREDAERLLNAVQTDELKVLQQLQDQEEESEGVVIDDW